MVVLVEGLATDASGARSAGQVASQGFGEHTSASEFPGAVLEGLCPLCHLTVQGEILHANRCHNRTGNVVE